MNADTVAVVGLGLLLAGVGTGVYGVMYVDSTADMCAPYHVLVDEDTSEYPDAPRVAYGNLTAEQREAIEETLETEPREPGRYRMTASEVYFERPHRVDYQGETYLVGTLEGEGCGPVDHLVRALPLLSGVFLSLLGLGLLRIGYDRHHTSRRG